VLTARHIQEITGGNLLLGNGTANAGGVSIDSRTMKKGDVFIAIQGDRLDGHDFVRQAVGKGAPVLVVSRKVACPKTVTVISVKDTTRALGQIASAHRRHFNIPVIAVTGSAGKTTTKDMIASVLGTRFKVLKNFRTENNQYGVPLTVLRLNASHEALVLELGTNRPGDIGWLTQIARPTIAVMTNIGESHLEGLKSKAGVFREKFDLVKGTAPDGHVIFNKDDPCLQKIFRKRIPQRMTTYALREQADYHADRIRLQDNRRISFCVRGRVFTLATPAEHGVYNALAAIACGRLLDISYGDMIDALRALRGADHRQEIRNVRGVLIVDDTYNSNPVSFAGALRTLDSLKAVGRKILITADMRELGRQSKRLHEEQGRLIARSCADVAVAVGRHSRGTAQAVKKANPRISTFYYPTVDDLHKRLDHVCQRGDIILVKGSRAMRMERTVAFIEEHLRRRSGERA
jgi:UDP-N-acetylmuramoyl-tripeptide--D-alanyl-D-alanine ligase